MPFDFWAILDFANALSNVICFGMFRSLKADDIYDEGKKEIFNWIQVFAVCVSWFRFFSFFLVLQSISILLMTLIQMLVKALTFVSLTVSYIIVMVPIFQIRFQDNTVNYLDQVGTARTLFDAMLGSYGAYFGDTVKDDIPHAIFLIVHIFISNIFLLNYLIAILSTVYEDMLALGDFAFKSFKYKYIERY